MDTVKGPYVITNTYNLCVVVLSNRGSTKFLPAYSRKDQTNGIIVIGYLEDQQHFVVVNYLIVLLLIL